MPTRKTALVAPIVPATLRTAHGKGRYRNIDHTLDPALPYPTRSSYEKNVMRLLVALATGRTGYHPLVLEYLGLSEAPLVLEWGYEDKNPGLGPGRLLFNGEKTTGNSSILLDFPLRPYVSVPFPAKFPQALDRQWEVKGFLDRGGWVNDLTDDYLVEQLDGKGDSASRIKLQRLCKKYPYYARRTYVLGRAELVALDRVYRELLCEVGWTKVS